MSINENFSDFIKRYKQEHNMSMAELAVELGVAKSALASYINGSGNPRADTIDFLAEKCGVSAEKMISAHPLKEEHAEIMGQAARLFGDLPPERRDKAIARFLALVDALSTEDHI